jgi:phage terminase Nu1 subunit (DNA packaging protein)
MGSNYATQVPAERLAQLLDLTPRRLQQLAAEGVIPKTDRNRYELVDSVRGYIRYLRDRAFGPEVQDGPNDNFAKQRARLTRSRADTEELKARQLLGELVPAAQIEAAWSAVTDIMRTRLLAIPAKTAARIGMARNAVEAQAIIRTEINEALSELANVTLAVIAGGHTPDAGADRDDDPAPTGAAAEPDGGAVGRPEAIPLR